MEAFGRSHDLVRGEGWNVFGAIVVVFLITIALSAVAFAIGGAIGGVGGLAIVSVIVATLTAPIGALVSAVLYFDLGGASTAAPVESAPPPPAPAA
jgi:hypothetical protein